MRIDLTGDPIKVDKEESDYDRFVADFLRCWPGSWNQVIVSGYVALVFGRERMTEDIDMLVAPPSDAEFAALWSGLHASGFWCLQTANPVSALQDYLRSSIALRFARTGKVEPNMEVKVIADLAGKQALAGRQQIVLNGRALWVSPLAMQVAYKLRLGSDKDFEDGLHIWQALTGRLKRADVEYWMAQLGVSPGAAERARLWKK